MLLRQAIFVMPPIHRVPDGERVGQHVLQHRRHHLLQVRTPCETVRRTGDAAAQQSSALDLLGHQDKARSEATQMQEVKLKLIFLKILVLTV